MVFNHKTILLLINCRWRTKQTLELFLFDAFVFSSLVEPVLSPVPNLNRLLEQIRVLCFYVAGLWIGWYAKKLERVPCEYYIASLRLLALRRIAFPLESQSCSRWG